MRKLFAVCTVLLIMFSFAGCSLNGRYDPNLSIGEQIKTRHYDGHASNFGKKELLDEILACFETKDVDRMKALFSDYALEQNEELSKQIEELYKVYPEVVEIKDRTSAQSGKHNRGSTVYQYKYQVSASLYTKSGERYRLICEWIEGESERPDMMGIHSVQLIDQKSYEKHKFTVHSWDDKPGAYKYIYED